MSLELVRALLGSVAVGLVSVSVASSRKIARLVRAGLIGAALLMGAALLATVWSTYAGVEHASETITRGQLSVMHRAFRGYGKQLGRAPTDDDLAQFVSDFWADGVRYVATLDRDGQVVASGGASTAHESIAQAVGSDGPGVISRAGNRSRYIFWKPSSRTHTRSMPFVIELEPKAATDLTSAARRTLTIGAVASAAFLLVALGLVRWLLRREAMERQIEQGRRLAALGEMSAVLAHEIRNPLASLKGNAQLLARSLPEGEKPRGKAERVVDEAVRLESLTNDLLEFARSGEIERTEVDPAALLREAAAGVDGERIRLDLDEAPASWPLDRERVRQVLTNLLENAVQAGPDAVSAAVRRRGSRLLFTVRDRGRGIPEAELARIFEPFYTLRTTGTGLGLAVAKRLVELHGGTITAANADGGGALFEIEVPRRRWRES